MPIYEYKCSECDHVFEKMQSFSASSTDECPKCGAKANRIISLSSFVLKGTGWYVTDYASKNRKTPLNNSKGTEKIKSPATTKPDTETTKTASVGKSSDSSSTTKTKSNAG